MAESFYVEGGGAFVSTENTVGPWNPDSQHAGPPAALVGRAIEGFEPRAGAQIARITFEILKPIPIATLRVEVGIVRPGRSVELLEATMSAGDAEVMRATAWRIRTEAVDAPSFGGDPPPAGPETAEPVTGHGTHHRCGYCEAMEWRFVDGAFDSPGPATAWMRMRYPLLPGEEPSPLTRVLIAADSGNGISSVIDPRRFIFINTELSVHLFRPPAGEWVCLKSQTLIGENGIGLAETELFDLEGRIGRGSQSLLIRRRS